MSEQIEARGTCRGEYQLVGREVPFGQTEISLNSAMALRDYVARTFFDKVDTKTPELSYTTDIVIGGRGFNDTGLDSRIATPSYFFGAVLTRMENAWRLRCAQTKSYRSEWNNSPHRIVTSYAMEAINGQLLEATKTVSIIRGVGDLSVGLIESGTEDVEIQRKMYEKLMTPDDCDHLHSIMENTIKRSAVSGRNQ